MKGKDLFLVIGVFVLILNKTISNEKTLLKLFFLIIGLIFVCIGFYKKFYERK